jgi:hypothetical protein
LYAEGLKRIARCGENDWRRFLLAECLEAYADLDEAQQQRLQALLTTEQYQEVRPVMITTYERGRIEERLETALMLLEAKFGPLSPGSQAAGAGALPRATAATHPPTRSSSISQGTRVAGLNGGR